jgi:hypothetical protein
MCAARGDPIQALRTLATAAQLEGRLDWQRAATTVVRLRGGIARHVGTAPATSASTGRQWSHL